MDDYWISSINFDNFDSGECNITVSLIAVDQRNIDIRFSIDANWAFEKQFFYNDKLYKVLLEEFPFQESLDEINSYIEKHWDHFEQIVISGVNSIRLFKNRNKNG